MLVTDHFVFLHVPKTGGTFVNRMIYETFERHGKLKRFHGRRADIPVKYRHMPVLATVRNPWDWYVSYYAYHRDNLGSSNPLFRSVSADGADFPSVTRNLVLLGSSRECSARHRALASAPPLESLSPEQQRKRHLELMLRRGDIFKDVQGTDSPYEREISGFHDDSRGYYQWLIDTILGVDSSLEEVHFCRFECLRDELCAALDRLGVEYGDATIRFLREARRFNASNHQPYRDYYASELRDLVAAKHVDVIRRFGYEF